MLDQFLHKYYYFLIIFIQSTFIILNADEQGIKLPELNAVIETTEEIMSRDLIKRSQAIQEEIPYHELPTLKSTLGQDNEDDPLNVPSFANEGYESDMTSGDVILPEATGDLGLTFEGARFNGSFPPDSMGHVGPTQFFVFCNGTLRTFNKNTGAADGVINTAPSNFFSTINEGRNAFDPRIRFDKFSNRWILVCINSGYPNRILLAISDTGTISSSTRWAFYYLDQDLVAPAGDAGLFADYETLGIDAKALYIGANMFGETSGFQGATAFVIRKSSVLNGGPIQAWAFRRVSSQNGMYTPQGADNFDPNPTYGYFIGRTGSRNNLAIRRINNLDSTPTISSDILITVPTFGSVLKVPHKGNTGGDSGKLSPSDLRLMSAHIRNGRLWTAHAVGVNNQGTATSPTRDACRWYEIDVAPANPVLVQAGTVFQPSASNTSDQRYYWMPGIMTNEQGDMLLGFSAAGENEYINCGYTYRLKIDPHGTTRAPKLYTNSMTAYNPTFDNGVARGTRRWGDYSYTSVDTDGSTFYTIQEYCGSPNIFNVQVARIQGSSLADAPPMAPVLNPIHISNSNARNYTVSWNNVATATSYVLERSISSNFTNPTTVAQGNITSHNVTNEANGTYYYRVKALNNSGSSPYSNVQSVTINVVPLAPVLNPINLTSPTSNDYTVSWSNVATATSYTLQRSTSSSFTNPDIIAQGNVTSFNVVDQANGTYYYRVYASNSAGNSTFSNVESVTVNPPEPTTVPAVPVLDAINISPTNPRNYTISWNSVANATAYTLQQSTTSSFTNAVIIAQGNLTSFNVVNQTNGIYYYRVWASNSAGNSTFSNVESITVSETTTDTALNVSYKIGVDWRSGYQGQITITNPSNKNISSWSGKFELPSDQKISSFWSAQFNVSGNTVRFSNTPWNGNISPNGSVTLGFVVVDTIPGGARILTNLTASGK